MNSKVPVTGRFDVTIANPMFKGWGGTEPMLGEKKNFV
jgi:hypothetical protein